MADTSESPAEQHSDKARGSSGGRGAMPASPASAASSADQASPEHDMQALRLAVLASSWRERLQRAVAGGQRGLMALALLVGAGAGLGAVAFRYMILGFTYLFTGHNDYSAVGHASNPLVPGLGIWFVVLVPVIGGLIYGPLVSRFAPEARGHGVPEVMYAVNRLGGRMRPQVPVVKSLASAVCIGAGGSVGREGPIVQIGSALGSVTGQLLRLPESQLRLLVACGAAGGISATFNAPIAGVFFALELILRNFETRSFGLVVLSSVTADAIGRAAFGSHPFLSLPGFTFSSPLELLLYAGLGVLATGVGLGFVRVLYAGEDIADRLWKNQPDWLRPAAGGVLLGLFLLAVPEMYGVGYPVLQLAVAGHYVILALLGLLAAKILATSLTMWIGGSGGVFAPSLFMGAMLGSAYGLRSRPNHRGLDHLRADRRLSDHPATDVRHSGRDRAQQRAHTGHDLHAQAAPPRDRHRRAPGNADVANQGRRGHGQAAAGAVARAAAARCPATFHS